MSFAMFKTTIFLLLNFNNENASVVVSNQNLRSLHSCSTVALKSQSLCFVLFCFAYGYLAFQKVEDFRLIYVIMFRLLMFLIFKLDLIFTSVEDKS